MRRCAFGNSLLKIFAEAPQGRLRLRSLFDLPGKLLIELDEPLRAGQSQYQRA